MISLFVLILFGFATSFTIAIDGSNVTVDGIAFRPDYNYSVPQAFFDEPHSDALFWGWDTDVYRVEDFGAVADPLLDNRAAIQAAIDACAAAGGGIVLLEAGTYGLAERPMGKGALNIRDNVFIKGRGMDKTVLRVLDGWSAPKLTGIIRSPWGEENKNYGVADLTLDGNRLNTEGKVDGFYSGVTPGTPLTDEDIWLIRVEVRNCSGYGFDPHERCTRLLITDCISHHNGLDGFVADYIIDGHYKNNVAYENDRHGFNIVTSTNDILLSDNIAHDNGKGGIVVQRGSFDIPLVNNVLIEGGETIHNGKEGVLILMSYNVEVDGVNIRDNGTYGVRIHGSSNVSVLNNRIIDNSRSKSGGYAGIQIKDYQDVKNTNRTYFSENNAINDDNVIEWTAGFSGKANVQVLAINEDIDADLYNDGYMMVIGTYWHLLAIGLFLFC